MGLSQLGGEALGGQLALPEPVWRRLNVAWVAYCLFMSAINAYVVVSNLVWQAFAR